MRVLLAADGSDCSWYALEEALRTLPLTTAQVFVVSVAPPTPVLGRVEQDMLTLRRAADRAREDLDAAVRALAAGGVRAVGQVRVGDAAREILAAARELRPDFIVMGSHGCGAAERFLMGSVSTTVVNQWEGAVIVVRKPASARPPTSRRCVADVMTRGPFCAELYQPVHEVAAMMAAHDTGFVPVLRDGKLAGVITDRDIVVRVLATGTDPMHTPVCLAATADVVWVTPEMPVDEAVRLMELYQIRRVVVMEGERVAGVVSLGDLAEALPETAEHALVEISKSPKTMAHGA
jgi:CBS domain-containing protein/nucleotide-binding universal stress UspA family protein